jgi:hypothetical protein
MVGGSPASSTTKTGRHDIAKTLLKVALNKINKSNQNSHSQLLRISRHLPMVWISPASSL